MRFHRGLAVCLVWPSLTPHVTWGQTALPRFVGRHVCLSCHGASAATRDRTGHPCRLEAIPEHNRSYFTLEKSEAKHIAALSGVIGSPAESRICLSCHATGAEEGRRWWGPGFDVTHGVQCESCHQAGSLHVETAGGRSQRRNERDESFIQKGTRADCRRCHIPRPSHDRVLRDGFRLQPDDADYKTPVNLAVSPDGRRLFVVCEHGNSLVVVDTESRRPIAEAAVGSRPHDVAVSEDGATLFVTNRMDATVSVVATDSMRVIRTDRVGHEPHGIVIDPDRDREPDRVSPRLIVANGAGNTLSVLDGDATLSALTLAAGQGPWSAAVDADDGLAVVTNVRPNPARFRHPPESELTIVHPRRGRVVSRVVVPGANMLQGIAPIPGRGAFLFTLVRSKNLVPASRLAQGWVITNGLGIYWTDGRVDQVLLDSPADYFPDPTDVAASPDGRRALVTSGGGDEVAVVDVVALLDLVGQSPAEARRDVLPNHLGMSSKFVVRRVAVGRNPRGVCYSPDGRYAYVANALDDTVSVLETTAYDVVATIELGGPTTTTHLRRGEQLFHSAAITFGRQFSCRSCHPDGHINGLTLDIEADGIGMHPVDNRSLRGILDTPPFKWEGTNPTLHRQCGPRLAVFLTRLDPYPPEDLDALVDYMCTIESPPNRFRRPDGLTDAQRRGQAVFERTRDNSGAPIPPQRRCATCHTGAYLTTREAQGVSTRMWFDAILNVELYDLFQTDEYGELGSYYFVDAGLADTALDIPHLRNIVESPPFLHNGAANTLEEIWTRFNMTDRHGATADLTRRQYNDLIAYLQSL